MILDVPDANCARDRKKSSAEILEELSVMDDEAGLRLFVAFCMGELLHLSTFNMN